MSDLLQFIFSGLTTGSIYALSALGFAIIYNASRVINFAQGDFLMLGGMFTVVCTSLGLPLFLAIPLSVLATVATGALLERLAIEPARNSSVVSLIIITIGASIFIQGVVQVFFGKNQHSVPSFSGDAAIPIGGAMLLPQSLWVIGVAAAMVILVGLFFRFTLVGKAMLAMSTNRMAAQLVGINTRLMLLISFGMAALLGAVAGIVAAPITTVIYDLGQMLGLKGFVAATLGGMGSGIGAVVGGLLVGLLEAFVAGYISSAYKDAVPFVLIIVILLVRPGGIFGAKSVDRV
ncbi:branched-chain amino acid ABC transporter permease [Eoetvoesiella caeni]|uniref:Amino acid/amide ABC transporter membrane protein 1 (HAAT family) n=1 Tax=Eoetvoesiella caeni TaxID=645616 RepID=A0A366HN06_9BURK|nr:branched-chain amino acid ABC transporter permease [Eoetvoesiella caeni]MCI2806991.1 branched-chain amino acid ABC transporter permease [Eoetvoesiella caeni]NYT53613.1 branched-chain amino acid ABC transporter permease [Eoetvoesiella caeni]RBP43601.1 amino acid/amide ABC transporter membrane protein 1 (HAAT family) [Eoetvoesiella caeni]